MKRDMDLIREILLKIEESKTELGSSHLAAGKNEEEAQDILYNLRQAYDAGLIKGITSNGLSDGWRIGLLSLTWDGHEFLDTLRDPNRWTTVKGIATKAGGVGIKALMDIGKAVAKGELQKLGIPIG